MERMHAPAIRAHRFSETYDNGATMAVPVKIASNFG